MAYNVTQKFRKQCYSGESNYTSNLTINGTQVPYEQIKSIKISSPIIDTTSNFFYIGTFISQQLTITFRNVDDLNINSGDEVTLSIGQMVDGTYEWCPIGKYIIDDLDENYHKTNQIVCLDYGVKFKKNVNFLPYMTEIKNEAGEVTGHEITIDEVLEAICEICDVELGDYPTTNGTIKIYSYDNQISGKEYISYIAELKGCNAKIGRDGKLNLIPLKQENKISINALKSKTWVLSEKFKITHVTFFSGVPELTTFPKDTSIPKENEVIIRQNNFFMQGMKTEDKEPCVENIYNLVKDFEMYSVKNENYGDPSMDAWDIIEFGLGETTYDVINDNEITFEQNIMVKIEPKVPVKNQEVNVNIYDDGTIDGEIRKVTQSIINPIDQSITDLIVRVDNEEKKSVEFRRDINGLHGRVEQNKTDIANLDFTIDGLKLEMTKTGDNLLRNTMFYDFEGWYSLSPWGIYFGDTPPTPNEYNWAPLWYCTKMQGNYESSKIYQYVSYDNGTTITHIWELTTYDYSHLSKDFPITGNCKILSNEDTRQRYVSGRALSISESSGTTETFYANSEWVELLDKEEKLTFSFNTTTKLNNSIFHIKLYLSEDRNFEEEKPTINAYATFEVSANLVNKLITKTIKIPRSRNTTSVYKSSTAPSDTSIYWLDDDNLLHFFDEELQQWNIFVTQTILRDQNNQLYYPQILFVYTNDGDFDGMYSYVEIQGNTFNPKYCFIEMYIFQEEEGVYNSSVEIGDIKLEYGEYSEWTPKNTEVMGITHLLDETGYKIQSGDDTMRLMIDELAQYYKDQKTFYINKTEVFSQNAKSITSDVDGLVTMSFKKGTKKLYGRYIR